MISIQTADPDSIEASVIMRAYLGEVASRYYKRPATPAEVDRALVDEPCVNLQGASGALFLAMEKGRAVACAGVRFGGDVAELTKVFTLPTHRGKGKASELLDHAERACRDRGAITLRLDTRAELAEACALYERLGFVRVEPFNQEPYSDRWYAKKL